MKPKLIHNFRKFCLNGTILGLKYLYLYTDRVSRVFWSTCIIFFLYFACVLTSLLYGRFQQTPTRIAIENQHAPVAQLPFPSVTLCSPNQLTISAIKHFEKTLVNGNRTVDMETLLYPLLAFYEFTNVDHDILEQLQSLIDLNRYTLMEVLTLLPQSCDKFLKLCFFHHKRFEKCKGLFKPIYTRRGLCCTFNNAYHYVERRRNEKQRHFKPEKILNTGLHHALTVITDYEPEDALDGTVLDSGSTMVMLTDWTEFPSDDESLMVPPNTESFHIMHATHTYCSEDVMDLPPSSRQCVFEDEYHLPYFHQYRNSDCDLMCFVSAVERVCHCLMLYVPHLRLQMACNVTSIPCIDGVVSQLGKLDDCDCPRDCDARSYRSDATVGNLKALAHMTRQDFFANIKFKKTTSLFHFVFQAPAYVLQKQETVMSLTTLFSNLGGVFGLCIGCSAITAVEIMFYIHAAIKYCIKSRVYKARQRRPPRPYSFYM